MTASEIAKELKISQSHVYDLLKELTQSGYVRKDGTKFVITDEGKLFLETADGIIRAHNTKVVLYAPEKKITRQDLSEIIQKAKKAELKNWEAYYIDLSKYGIEDKVQVNIAERITVIIHLKEYKFNTLDQAMLIVNNRVAQIRKALAIEGIFTSPEWIDFELGKLKIYAEYAAKIDERLPVTPGVEIEFERNAKDLKGQELEAKAKAWIDESKGYKEIESNDTEYTEKLILVPERVEKIEKILEANNEYFKNLSQAANALAEAGKGFAENINAHIPYVQNAALALGRITQVIELQQQQQTQFLQAMQNQNKMIELLSELITKNGNNGNDKQTPWFKLLIPLLLILLLLTTVKGVIF